MFPFPSTAICAHILTTLAMTITSLCFPKCTLPPWGRKVAWIPWRSRCSEIALYHGGRGIPSPPYTLALNFLSKGIGRHCIFRLKSTMKFSQSLRRECPVLRLKRRSLPDTTLSLTEPEIEMKGCQTRAPCLSLADNVITV